MLTSHLIALFALIFCGFAVDCVLALPLGGPFETSPVVVVRFLVLVFGVFLGSSGVTFSDTASSVTATLWTALSLIWSAGRGAPKKPSELRKQRLERWSQTKTGFVFTVLDGVTDLGATKVLPRTQAGMKPFAVPSTADWTSYLANSETDKEGFLDTLTVHFIAHNGPDRNGERVYFPTPFLTGSGTGRVYYSCPTTMTAADLGQGISQQYNEYVKYALAQKDYGKVAKVFLLLQGWGYDMSKEAKAGLKFGVLAWSQGYTHPKLDDAEGQACRDDLALVIGSMAALAKSNRTLASGSKKMLTEPAGIKFFKK